MANRRNRHRRRKKSAASHSTQSSQSESPTPSSDLSSLQSPLPGQVVVIIDGQRIYFGLSQKKDAVAGLADPDVPALYSQILANAVDVSDREREHAKHLCLALRRLADPEEDFAAQLKSISESAPKLKAAHELSRLERDSLLRQLGNYVTALMKAHEVLPLSEESRSRIGEVKVHLRLALPLLSQPYFEHIHLPQPLLLDLLESLNLNNENDLQLAVALIFRNDSAELSALGQQAIQFILTNREIFMPKHRVFIFNQGENFPKGDFDFLVRVFSDADLLVRSAEDIKNLADKQIPHDIVKALAQYARTLAELQKAELDDAVLDALSGSALIHMGSDASYSDMVSRAKTRRSIALPELSDDEAVKLMDYAVRRAHQHRLSPELFLQKNQLSLFSLLVMRLISHADQLGRQSAYFVYLSQMLSDSPTHLRQLRDHKDIAPVLARLATEVNIFNAMLLQLKNQPEHLAALVGRYVTAQHLLASEELCSGLTSDMFFNAGTLSDLAKRILNSLADAAIPLEKRVDLLLLLSQQLAVSKPGLTALFKSEEFIGFLGLLASDSAQRNRLLARLNQDAVAKDKRNAVQQGYLMGICKRLGGAPALIDSHFQDFITYFGDAQRIPQIVKPAEGSIVLSGLWGLVNGLRTYVAGSDVDNYATRLEHFKQLLAAVQGGNPDFDLTTWKSAAAQLPGGYRGSNYLHLAQAITPEIVAELRLMPNALFEGAKTSVATFEKAVADVRAHQAAEVAEQAASIAAVSDAAGVAAPAPTGN